MCVEHLRSCASEARDTIAWSGRATMAWHIVGTGLVPYIVGTGLVPVWSLVCLNSSSFTM